MTPPPAFGQAAPAAPPLPAGALAGLGDAQIDNLVAPFAGAPPAALGVIFDAARYPSALMEAKAWAAKPEAERGAPNENWPPSVSRLAERAPQAVDYLTSNMAMTSALGAAYQETPDKVWQAYGKATANLQAQQAPADATDQTAAAPAAPTDPPPPVTPQQQAAPAQEPAPAPAPPPAPPAQAAAPATVVEQAPTTVIVQQPAPVVVQSAPVTTTSSGDTTSAALMGGAVGLIGGLALANIFDDDDDNWHGGYPYPAPYPAYGARNYEDARALQDDRQAAASDRQTQRQDAASGRQEQRQDAAADRQQNRQDNAGNRPDPRQQTARGSGTAQTRPGAAQRPTAASNTTGGNRRAAATGQARPAVAPQRPAAQQAAPQRAAAAPARPAAAPTRAAAAPQRSMPQRPPSREWGPTQGASGGRAARGGGGGGGGRAAGGGGGRGGRR